MTREGLQEPVGTALLAVLRAAVLEHVTTEPRRVFPAVLHVGLPGRWNRRVPDPPDDGAGVLDHALRVDVLEAAVAAARRRAGGQVPLVWLTRVSDPRPQDVDQAWTAAVRAASAEQGLDLPFVVVDRTGWRDPRSGTSRRWRRMRVRSGP